MKKHIEDIVFTEKYRAKLLKDVILPDRIRNRFSEGFKINTLLYSTQPGTFKSTTCKAVINEFKHPYLYVNCSKDAGIDDLREKILDFCSTISVLKNKSNSPKVVFLDELDGASTAFYKGLRSFMEEFSYVMFVATCNDKNKLPEPILSRFDKIDFTFNDDDKKKLAKGYITSLLNICKLEGIKIEQKAIVAMLEKFFPDMRSMLNLLQGFKTEKKEIITEEDINKSHSAFNNLFELAININCESDKIYETIMENYSNKTDLVLSSFFTDFVKFIQEEHKEYKKFIPIIVQRVAYYQSIKHSVIDNVLVPIAMIYEINELFKNNK